LLDAVDRVTRGLQIVRRLGGDGVGVGRAVGVDRRRGGDDHDLFVAGGNAVEELLGHDLGLVEVGLGVGAADLVRHGVGVVDDDDVEGGALAAQRGDRAVVAAEGAGERQAHEEDQQAAHRQEQPLLELDAAAVFPHRVEQVFHRGPLDDLEAAAVEEVDDDRDGRQRRAGEGEPGIDEPGGENGSHVGCQMSKGKCQK
jgi:hypothetical protein